MKKLSILFLSLVAMSNVFTSCDDDDNNTPPPASTNMELIIKDAAGAVVSDADVMLYATEDDFFNGENQIGATLKSDANGKVLFKNLQAKAYYFRVKKADGCLDNLYTIPVTYDANTGDIIPLVAGKTNTFEIPLVPMGTLTFTNNSGTDSYNVYIKQNGGTGTYQKIGALSPTAGQNSGAISVPTVSWDLKFVKLDSSGNEVSGSDVEKLNNVVTACGNTTVNII